jgi:hypothetical protein
VGSLTGGSFFTARCTGTLVAGGDCTGGCGGVTAGLVVDEVGAL